MSAQKANAPDALPFEDLEEVYEMLAKALDQVGEDNHALFLAKLAVTMAHKCNDLDLVREAVAIALDDGDDGAQSKPT